MFADLVVESKNYHLFERKDWRGQVQGMTIGTGIGVGKMWAYVFQSDAGEMLGFVVKYPFTVGTKTNTDNYGLELKMIEKAVETDLEGIQAKARSRSAYEIDTGISPYKEILEQPTEVTTDANGGAGFFIF